MLLGPGPHSVALQQPLAPATWPGSHPLSGLYPANPATALAEVTDTVLMTKPMFHFSVTTSVFPST